MATKHGKYCPECGKDGFEKEQINGDDTGDLVCSNCQEVNPPCELLNDAAPQTCKNCKTFFSAQRSYLFKDYVANLKKGIISCPECKAVHNAVDVVINEKGGFAAYRGSFGDLVN
jgi:hypothetical protein